MKVVECYFPGPRFPSVSITGSKCSLACPHCMALPLSAMIPAETPEELKSLAQELDRDGALGFLLSGGCDPSGAVPLDDFLDAIRSIKRCTALRINAHVGFPRSPSAKSLAETGIDSFSVTFPMNDRIGKEVFRVDSALKRYEETVEALRGNESRIVPHALIGIESEAEEIDGLKTLATFRPESVVINVFMRFRGTPLSAAPSPDDDRVLRTVSAARSFMPRAKIVLGCMRPRGRHGLERTLMSGHLDGIVMPSAEALRRLPKGIQAKKREGCCALYL